MAGVMPHVDEEIPACDLQYLVSSTTPMSKVLRLGTSTYVTIIFHGAVYQP